MRALNRPRTVGGVTRDRLVDVLRRTPGTVDELASSVGLTPSAVRQHLASLERDGLVSRRGVRRAPGGGKPATVYQVSAEAERAFSRAYAPTLAALLDALPDHLVPGELDRLLHDVGVRLAAGAPAPRGDFRQRVRAAAAVLESLGGVVEIREDPPRAVVVGCSCPLAQAVAARPELCRALEVTLATVTGARVEERCDRSNAPRCRFEIGPWPEPAAMPADAAPA